MTCIIRRLLPMSAAFLAGCSAERMQSALHPAGPAAAQIAWLWWAMFWAFSAVFALVLILLSVAIARSDSRGT